MPTLKAVDIPAEARSVSPGASSRTRAPRTVAIADRTRPAADTATTVPVRLVPHAYAVTSSPTAEGWTPRPAASCGISPIGSVSVVMYRNVDSASAVSVIRARMLPPKRCLVVARVEATTIRG
jgi:hypothetical protein